MSEKIKHKYSLLNFVPLNLEEEKEKFFSQNGDYNPQFVYNREFDEGYLKLWGEPDQEKVAEIGEMLESGKLSLAKEPVNEKILSITEMKKEVADLVKQLGLPEIKVIFKKGLSSRFLLQITDQSLFIRQGDKISRSKFDRALNHEIQTHYLRGCNETLQPWAKKKERKRKNWLRTEEGLAIINAHRESKSENDFFSAYFRYFLTGKAQTTDFKNMYRLAMRYVGDENKSWAIAMRAKRGIKDTSLGGGYTKDIVYLEGLGEVRNWLKNPKNKMKDLYWGRVGVNEVENLRAVAKTEGILLPSWLR